MRPICSKLFLLSIFVLFTFQLKAQTCTGALGDPVIDQDFGSGTNPGAPLLPSVTNMTYTTSNCPNDGEYTISNSLSGAGNCHPSTWHNVPADHTGNPNGYMMIVNASNEPSVFFNQAATGLCPNTTYEFSAYILNLITLAAALPGVSEPDIIFSIETSAGVVLAKDTTGTIPSTAGVYWYNYGVYFTTPANVTDVVVKMTNLAPGGNGNDLILDDITFRACGPIIQEGFSSVGGPKGADLCQGGSGNFTLKAQVQGNGTPSLQWQQNISGAGWNDIPGQNTNTYNAVFVNANTGVYQYRLGVANGSDITAADCRVYSSPLTVYVNPLPVVPAIAPQTICEGYTLTLNASGGASYIWSGPNLPPTLQNPVVINNVTPANAGTYTVQAMSDSSCSAAPVQAIVKVVPKVVAAISNNVTICSGTSTQLTASGGVYYRWTPTTGLDNPNIADPVASPLQTTTYTVDVSNGSCDDSTRTVTVTVTQSPSANAGKEIFLFEGQSAKLQGSAKGDSLTSVYWSPATGLSDPNSLTPVATPADDITYTLNVVSKTCGTATDTVFVRVYKKITIPNTFSPNNDGKNDTWDIEALFTYPESTTQVFNRYGQQVFQSTGYSRPWNGTYNGSPLPAGTYYYIIDLKDGQPKLSGWVLIIR